MARRASTAVGALLACCGVASALNPSLDINQYAHKAWTVRDGFFTGTINAIAQTPDGYLWLGTEFGLLRFDGVRSTLWEPPAGMRLPSSDVSSLLVARDGRLWIGTTEGLASWKDAKLTPYPELAGLHVESLLEDREETVWAGAFGVPTGRLCVFQGGIAHCFGEDGGFGSNVESLCEDSRGNLWAAAANGLWRWKPGPPKLYPMADREVSALIEGENGTLPGATHGGITQFVEERVGTYPLPGVGRQFNATRLLRDRDGGLWVGTPQGLLHVYGGKTDLFTQSDGLSSDSVLGLFEDREGDIWVATVDGLDRFRDFAVSTISVKQGLSNAAVWSVLPARDGSVWFGTLDGLNRWKDGLVTVYRKGNSGLPGNANSLFQDEGGRIWLSTLSGVAYFENGRFIPVPGVPGGNVHSIAGDRGGNLWISNQDHGLFHLLGENEVEQIQWASLGRKDVATTLLPDTMRGGLWIGFFQGGGLAYLKDGQVRESYTDAEGLGKGRVGGLQLDGEGTLWAATVGGLSRVKNRHVATLTSKNGLPCESAQWVVEDDDHAFWLGMACGVVRIGRSELEAWAADPNRTVQVTVFGSSDGVRSHPAPSGFNPGVAKSADGKIWFLPLDGVSVIDPRHLPFNKLPPPVHIEQIIADRKTQEASSNLRLPPLTRDLEIDYTALSLVAPEKNRFRVKLEGHDPDWIDMGNERKKYYNDLPPRNYRFRVMASNNNGVWNEAGAAFDFSVAPAYYQTTRFLMSCGAVFLAMLLGLYHLRARQIARQFSVRMEERVNERTRLARDLHDTLLQSFQGVLLKFHAASFLLPDRPLDARNTLEGAIEQAREAISEGRDAVQGLRSSLLVAKDLARAISLAGEELVSGQSGGTSPGIRSPGFHIPSFHIEVEGASRNLVPLLQDEVYRIACEALHNAFKHAQASRIEAEIRYDPRQFRLRIRDDGKGIDPKVLGTAGRPGHYGLPGMKERAKLVGGKLVIWSELDSGTEVEVTIPAAIAYAKSSEAIER